jgi:hypothetical protein
MKPEASPTVAKRAWLAPRMWKMRTGGAEGVYGSHGFDGIYNIS